MYSDWWLIITTSLGEFIEFQRTVAWFHREAFVCFCCEGEKPKLTMKPIHSQEDSKKIFNLTGSQKKIDCFSRFYVNDGLKGL